MTIRARAFVDVVHAGGIAFRIDGDFAHHRIGHDIHVARGERRRQQHRRRLEVGLDAASVAARRRPETRLSAQHRIAQHTLREFVAGVNLLRQRVLILALRHDGQVRRNHRNAHRRRVLLGQQLHRARCGRGLQHAG
jgi:hypothetical protein